MIGMHFFNPVQLMRLVEVIKTDSTDPAVFARAMEFAKSLSKTPVECIDTPGFVVNRLLVPYMCSALLLVERGVATAADTDVAMRLGAGHPMGPIQLADYVGLDTCLSIMRGWAKEFPDEPAFAVPKSLEAKVAEGKLGRKSGEGFYKWDGDKLAA
jgi:3-hydroxyacyl-CoA dehydrogenase